MEGLCLSGPRPRERHLEMPSPQVHDVLLADRATIFADWVVSSVAVLELETAAALTPVDVDLHVSSSPLCGGSQLELARIVGIRDPLACGNYG